MGELHLEVILERIRREYGIAADIGPLMVAYKETAAGIAANTNVNFERKISNVIDKVEVDISARKDPTRSKASLFLSKNKEHIEELKKLKKSHLELRSHGESRKDLKMPSQPVLYLRLSSGNFDFIKNCDLIFTYSLFQVNAHFEITRLVIGKDTAETIIYCVLDDCSSCQRSPGEGQDIPVGALHATLDSR